MPANRPLKIDLVNDQAVQAAVREILPHATVALSSAPSTPGDNDIDIRIDAGHVGRCRVSQQQVQLGRIDIIGTAAVALAKDMRGQIIDELDNSRKVSTEHWSGGYVSNPAGVDVELRSDDTAVIPIDVLTELLRMSGARMVARNPVRR